MEGATGTDKGTEPTDFTRTIPYVGADAEEGLADQYPNEPMGEDTADLSGSALSAPGALGTSQDSRAGGRRSSHAAYEIIIRGELSEEWSTWLAGLSVTHNDDGETRIYGVLPDQSALHGVLERIRDLNLELVEVRKLVPGELRSGRGTAPD